LPDWVVRSNGRIEMTRTDIAVKYPGRLVSLLVHEGDVVQVGQVIAQQDDAEHAQRAHQVDSGVAVAGGGGYGGGGGAEAWSRGDDHESSWERCPRRLWTRWSARHHPVVPS
jgi:pyruvate/2-oxoglutarate dehydrogenase complex dihydrolipoamide acyltransferase (E2) component